MTDAPCAFVRKSRRAVATDRCGRAQAPGLAYGVDPKRKERCSLRQARYDAIAVDIDRWADSEFQVNASGARIL